MEYGWLMIGAVLGVGAFIVAVMVENGESALPAWTNSTWFVLGMLGVLGLGGFYAFG